MMAGKNLLFALLMLLVAQPVALTALPTLSSAARIPLALSRTLVRGPVEARTAAAGLELSSAREPRPVEVHGAMPFVSVDPSNQTLSVNPDALQALAALPAPICVMSIGGAAQEGKSSWLNMFSHWLLERWPTVGAAEAGGNFKVGQSIFDTGNGGASIRLFTGKGTREPTSLPARPVPRPLCGGRERGASASPASPR